MKHKYILRKFVHYFSFFTFPILLMGILTATYCFITIKKDINLQAQSTFYAGTELMEQIVLTGSDISTIFDNNPTVSLSLHKILNRNSLSYKEYVVNNVLFSILENAKSNSRFIESIYIYLENNENNYYQTDKKTVSLIDASDQEWLSIFQNMDKTYNKWVMKRSIKNYAFEKEHTCISIFRRISAYDGVLVTNLNTSILSELLSSIENYANESIIVTDQNGYILFSNDNALNLQFNLDQDIFSQLSHLKSDEGRLLSTVEYKDNNYILNEFTSNEYGLHFISLVLEKDIYQVLYQIIIFFTISILISTLFCLLFSLFIANQNFNQISNLINVLAMAESGTYVSENQNMKKPDEYNLILNHVIGTFIKNNILTMQLKESDLRKTKLELESLQLQINPHFFFNTLQSINVEIMKKEGTEAPAIQLIQNLSHILRYALEDASSPVSLKDEIQSCKEYLYIQQFQHVDQISLLWEYNDDILDCSVLRLIFQPLIENSIQYSLLKPTDQCIIYIRIQDRGDHLRFHILDTGKGMSKEKLKELRESLNSEDSSKRSIGLKNIHKRLILSYPNNKGITIISHKDQGTCISFSIPKIKA